MVRETSKLIITLFLSSNAIDDILLRVITATVAKVRTYTCLSLSVHIVRIYLVVFCTRVPTAIQTGGTDNICCFTLLHEIVCSLQGRYVLRVEEVVTRGAN